ncbi:MAG: glycosyl hydrolase [Acidobacteria bacterium]|nr:glycosyl hydrolase [Acidobacteriota bacterium]
MKTAHTRLILVLFTLSLIIAGTICSSNAQQSSQATTADSLLKGLQWRSIGPFRGGRVTAVAGVPSQPMVYYFGATGGGVWKTTDGGVNWDPISDEYFTTGSVGAIGVSESDPNVIYVGMGESPIRGNVSHGDGVYKSTDAGKTWKKVGLDDTRHIGRVRVHPKNPDLVYVAALGHIFGPNEQRGVFRSKDGGRTWEKVLYRNNKAGAIDLILDPSNPNVIYAGFWEVFRTPYSMESGGPGSGLFKSTDGGDTWNEITRNPGMPRGLVGKVGITVSAVNPERLWAIIEAEDGGVFRSDNGGRSWIKVNDQRNLRQRAWYYTRLYADTKNIDTVYVLNVGFYKSNDGGRSYTTLSPPHGDNHDMWIAPDDAQRMINGNDGGANVSFNGGRTWTEQDQPTAQFYRVAIDNDFPYHIYGAQQDNSTVKIRSRSMSGGITTSDWEETAGSESGWVVPHPKDSNVVFGGNYGGYLSRLDHRTGQNRNITVWPDNPMGWGAEGMKYRFQWNFPIAFSPHDPNTLYTGGNVLFKSTNEGQSWQAISGDLTRNDKTKLGPSGGPITKDNTSVEYYCTIFALQESPVQKGVIWTGSDDGLVHVTRDGGQKWDNVTPKEMPSWMQINSIEASPHDPAAAYFAGTMYKSDDFRPYLYKTADFGKTWKRINNGIPATAFTRVIREDPNRRGLLYAGTETGIYFSFNDGESWQSLQLNLPVVPITDLAVHKREKDLVAATQGRSFWVLDDLPVLHQWKDSIAGAATHLFKPEDSYRMAGPGRSSSAGSTVGANPPAGAVIWYHLKDKPKGEVILDILDGAGKQVKRFSSKAAEGEQPSAAVEEGAPASGRAARVSAERGLNRFVWDLRYIDATRFPGLIMWSGNTSGPRAVPGTYQVKLTVDDQNISESFELKKDPRLSTTQEEFQKQFDLLIQIRNKLSEIHGAISEIRDIRRQVDEYTRRIAGQANTQPIAEAAKSLKTKLTAIEEELYQTKNQSNQDPLNYPIRLNNKLAALASVVASADSAPTDQSYQVVQELTARIDAQLTLFKQLVSTDLPAFNRLAREKEVPAVFFKSLN